MIIPIDKEHRITSSEYSWDIERLTKSKGGKYRWNKVGYYSTFGSALQGAAQREIRLTPTVGLEACAAAASAVQHKYARIFDEIHSKYQGELDKVKLG